MSLAHSTIKDLQVDRVHPETDPEIIDILRGCEQHYTVQNLYTLASRITPAAGEIVGAAMVQGFLLGQAFEQANSLERLVGQNPCLHPLGCECGKAHINW